jgi:hypothetical protein
MKKTPQINDDLKVITKKFILILKLYKLNFRSLKFMIWKRRRENARFNDRKKKLTLTLILATKIIYFDIKIFYLIRKV